MRWFFIWFLYMDMPSQQTSTLVNKLAYAFKKTWVCSFVFQMNCTLNRQWVMQCWFIHTVELLFSNITFKVAFEEIAKVYGVGNCGLLEWSSSFYSWSNWLPKSIVVIVSVRTNILIIVFSVFSVFFAFLHSARSCWFL